MQILDEVPMIWGSCFMVYTMQGVLTLFFNLLWILSSSICNLTKTISRRQYQAGSQGNITRRERRTLRIMVWQFSFCFTASSLPWSTSSCLIPPSSWWPTCIVLANFRPNSYHFFFQTCIAWFLVGLLYFPRWCMPSLLLEAFGRHCPCWSLTTVPLVQGQIFQRFKTSWNSITTQTEAHILIWIQIILGKLTALPHRIRSVEHRYVPLSISSNYSKPRRHFNIIS